jgi:hypothetical protein
MFGSEHEAITLVERLFLSIEWKIARDFFGAVGRDWYRNFVASSGECLGKCWICLFVISQSIFLLEEPTFLTLWSLTHSKVQCSQRNNK